MFMLTFEFLASSLENFPRLAHFKFCEKKGNSCYKILYSGCNLPNNIRYRNGKLIILPIQFINFNQILINGKTVPLHVLYSNLYNIKQHGNGACRERSLL